MASILPPSVSAPQLRESLRELSESCPFHRSNPEDCPLFALRRMPCAEIRQWVNSLSEDELTYLAVYHHTCLRLEVESHAA